MSESILPPFTALFRTVQRLKAHETHSSKCGTSSKHGMTTRTQAAYMTPPPMARNTTTMSTVPEMDFAAPTSATRANADLFSHWKPSTPTTHSLAPTTAPASEWRSQYGHETEETAFSFFEMDEPEAPRFALRGLWATPEPVQFQQLDTEAKSWFGDLSPLGSPSYDPDEYPNFNDEHELGLSKSPVCSSHDGSSREIDELLHKAQRMHTMLQLIRTVAHTPPAMPPIVVEAACDTYVNVIRQKTTLQLFAHSDESLALATLCRTCFTERLHYDVAHILATSSGVVTMSALIRAYSDLSGQLLYTQRQVTTEGHASRMCKSLQSPMLETPLALDPATVTSVARTAMALGVVHRFDPVAIVAASCRSVASFGAEFLSLNAITAAFRKAKLPFNAVHLKRAIFDMENYEDVLIHASMSRDDAILDGSPYDSVERRGLVAQSRFGHRGFDSGAPIVQANLSRAFDAAADTIDSTSSKDAMPNGDHTTHAMMHRRSGAALFPSPIKPVTASQYGGELRRHFAAPTSEATTPVATKSFRSPAKPMKLSQYGGRFRRHFDTPTSEATTPVTASSVSKSAAVSSKMARGEELSSPHSLRLPTVVMRSLDVVDDQLRKAQRTHKILKLIQTVAQNIVTSPEMSMAVVEAACDTYVNVIRQKTELELMDHSDKSLALASLCRACFIARLHYDVDQMPIAANGVVTDCAIRSAYLVMSGKLFFTHRHLTTNGHASRLCGQLQLPVVSTPVALDPAMVSFVARTAMALGLVQHPKTTTIVAASCRIVASFDDRLVSKGAIVAASRLASLPMNEREQPGGSHP